MSIRPELLKKNDKFLQKDEIKTQTKLLKLASFNNLLYLSSKNKGNATPWFVKQS